jgi:hypothetical protein
MLKPYRTKTGTMITIEATMELLDPTWQRKGIATAMFELAYDMIGSRLQTSTDLTDNGRALAAARAKHPNRNRSRFCLAKADFLIDSRTTQIACTRDPLHEAPCGSRIHRTSTYGVWTFGEPGQIVEICPWLPTPRDY